MESRDRKVKFKSLAEKRTNAAIKYIRLLGNLSNTSNYEYLPEDVDQIRDALQREVKQMLERFNLEGAESKRFTLKS
jgi:hypothetical protein